MNTSTFHHPDFLIIGAGKSGTTALYKYLQQHPQVFMPTTKEPDFFALEGETPTDPKNDPEKLHYYPQAVYDAEEYQNLFQEAKEDQLTGEASTLYLYKEGTHEKIKQYRPDIKMIAIFRNPAERLYSRYLHLARIEEQPEGPLENIFDKSTIWWRRNDLIYEGFYYQHLSKYFHLFKPEQIKIFLYEDLKQDDLSVIKEVYEFLGVDDQFQPDTSIRFNESGFIKNKWKEYLFGNQSIIRRMTEKIAPGFVQNLRKNPQWQKKVKQLRRQNLDRPEMSKELKQRIIDDIYKKDILKFQELINRDLSHWLKP
ncbi:MAG: sulfotransferase domain-containing protein [Bacteroidales bacterium]|nr:sulfotransferase domain-containing protein [Bacteroidales bacterium]MCF8326950.1 sulfotransferase domain-containing protein [Bacteroidales bacterium]